MKMLVSVNISKCFNVQLEMAKSLNPEMETVGVKIVQSGTNPDESKVFMIVDMKDPSQMKTFGEREDVAKARADVASTAIISQIGEGYLPQNPLVSREKDSSTPLNLTIFVYLSGR